MKRLFSFLSISALLSVNLLSPMTLASHNFNLELIIQDEDGDAVENLRESDFEISGGDDNEIYDFDEVDDGVYKFELNGDDDDDTKYSILIDDFQSFSTGSLDEGLTTYLVILNDYDIDDEDKDFNLKLILEDEDGDRIENLRESDFRVTGGDDNKIYDFEESADGEYKFALNGDEDDDTKYSILIDDFATFNTGSLDEDLTTYYVDVEGYDIDDEDDDHDDCDDHDFRDVNNHWVEDALEGHDGLLCREVIEGRDRYNFDPNDFISRAEFLAMVIRNADIDVDDYDDEDEPFVDISRYDWEYEYVVAAYELDIIDYDRFFRPNENINRAEMITMLLRAENIDIDGGSNPFIDVRSSKWYYDEVTTAYELDLITGFFSNGYRTFEPAKDATRAEAAELVNNAYEELR